MKILLLVCASLVAGTSVLHARSIPTSVYDYYDFVDIPKTQPIAASRSDGPIRGPMARASGPLPRRVPLPPRRPVPVPVNRPKPELRHQQPRPHRPVNYRPAESQFRPKPRPQQPYRPQRPQRPKKQPELQYYEYEEFPPVYQDDPIFYAVDEPIFVEQPQFPRESAVDFQDERPTPQDAIEYYDDDSPLYEDERLSPFQEEIGPQYKEERKPQYQEERRPQYQEERRPQYQEERRPQHQEERLPQYQEERLPQYQEERQPQYEEVRPAYQEERPPQYHEERRPQHQEERPLQHKEEPLPKFEEPSAKDLNRPPVNNYRTTQNKETEPVKEKRDAIHSDGHLDEKGIQFAADAAAIENAKGAGRLAFQIHGQQGPHSYRFGYDTGKGENRQFRYEERDGYGQVHGRYGFYDEDGKLQVVNYSAHPEHGFTADVPH